MAAELGRHRDPSADDVLGMSERVYAQYCTARLICITSRGCAKTRGQGLRVGIPDQRLCNGAIQKCG
jgi:hypothetical protein